MNSKIIIFIRRNQSYFKIAAKISVKNAAVNNLRNINVDISLNKLVVIVGKSGSGKYSLIYDVLRKASQGCKVDAQISDIHRTFAISRKVKPVDKLSLGETNMKRLSDILKEIKRNDFVDCR